MTIKPEAREALNLLKSWMSPNQWAVCYDACHGQEAEFFQNKMIEQAEVIRSMPATYETDGDGSDAMCYLHYFRGGADYHVIEKDRTPDSQGIHHQAFGLCDLGMGFPELGYIDIGQLTEYNFDLDLYWEPQTLRQVKAA